MTDQTKKMLALAGLGGIGTEKAKGLDSASRLAPSFLTAASDRASLKNNEPPR